MKGSTFRKNTTPTLRFAMPYPLDMVRGGTITLSQRDEIIVQKDFTDDSVTISRGWVKVKLTREETRLFSSQTKGEAQLHVELPGDNAAESDPVEFMVGKSLMGGSK